MFRNVVRDQGLGGPQVGPLQEAGEDREPEAGRSSEIVPGLVGQLLPAALEDLAEGLEVAG